MYLENWATVFPIKKQMMVASRNESGISGPALRAMIGNVKTMLVAGAIWVTLWKISSGRPSEFRRRWGSMGSVVTRGRSPSDQDERQVTLGGLLRGITDF